MKFDEYFIGQKALVTETFTAEKVMKFAELTGDFNPIHLDEEYSKNTHFKNCIVHGTYVTSVIGTALGTLLPGLGTILIAQEHKFVAPVYVGEVITLEVEITEIKAAKYVIVLSINCRNKNNEIVITGKAVTKKKY